MPIYTHKKVCTNSKCKLVFRYTKLRGFALIISESRQNWKYCPACGSPLENSPIGKLAEAIKEVCDG